MKAAEDGLLLLIIAKIGKVLGLWVLVPQRSFD
jgi:hypothetical protein